MNSGSFDGGLLNLTSWVGNAVRPIFAALILAMGIYKYSRGYHIDSYIAGTLAALSVSGLLRLAEVFASQGSGTTQYWSAILSLANSVPSANRMMGSYHRFTYRRRISLTFSASEITRGYIASRRRKGTCPRWRLFGQVPLPGWHLSRNWHQGWRWPTYGAPR